MRRTRDAARTVMAVRHSVIPFPAAICYPVSNVAGGCGSSVWEFEKMDDLFIELKEQLTPKDIKRVTHKISDYMYENHMVVPMYFLFAKVAFDPGILVEYHANMLHMGPVRHHEYTVPVYK